MKTVENISKIKNFYEKFHKVSQILPLLSKTHGILEIEGTLKEGSYWKLFVPQEVLL